jgi:hypothetical protein
LVKIVEELPVIANLYIFLFNANTINLAMIIPEYVRGEITE